ncbi:unnamed protein product, partial [Mesorhabditis belari]|uniref:Uncharacterized protein n=1 Tax=Mesorhabditis belari TaxID=2138241 RepID=A0AAF3FB65_9BILA
MFIGDFASDSLILHFFSSLVEHPKQIQYVIDTVEEILRSLVPAEVAEYSVDNPPPSGYNFRFERGTTVTETVTVEETEVEIRNQADDQSVAVIREQFDLLVSGKNHNRHRADSLDLLRYDSNEASKSSDELVKKQKQNKKTSPDSTLEDGQKSEKATRKKQKSSEPQFGVVVSGTVTIQRLDRPEEPPKNIDFKFDCPGLEPHRVWVNGRWRDL